jgi:hypothetical protein
MFLSGVVQTNETRISCPIQLSHSEIMERTGNKSSELSSRILTSFLYQQQESNLQYQLKICLLMYENIQSQTDYFPYRYAFPGSNSFASSIA